MTTRNWIAVGPHDHLAGPDRSRPAERRADHHGVHSDLQQADEIFKETQSILRAIDRLYDSKNYFVAGLILLFSVIVPFIKTAFLARDPLVEESRRRNTGCI